MAESLGPDGGALGRALSVLSKVAGEPEHTAAEDAALACDAVADLRRTWELMKAARARSARRDREPNTTEKAETE